MTNGYSIIGVVLVKNEDLFIEPVLGNIIDFCDRIIVADNLSTDNTSKILEKLCKQESKIEYHSVQNPSESHDLIKGFAGEKVWIFAVDGDELYDPQGLKLLRQKLLQGYCSDSWMIFGNVLNCTEFMAEQRRAVGYLAPPCRSMTKLYNFLAIQSWEGPCSERLHGGHIVFKKGYDKSLRFELHKQRSWEDSEFRCLHLCFVKRSSLEKKRDNTLYIRKNISDLTSETIIEKLLSMIKRLIGITQSSTWKREKYMRGNKVSQNISMFIRS